MLPKLTSILSKNAISKASNIPALASTSAPASQSTPLLVFTPIKNENENVEIAKVPFLRIKIIVKNNKILKIILLDKYYNNRKKLEIFLFLLEFYF